MVPISARHLSAFSPPSLSAAASVLHSYITMENTNLKSTSGGTRTGFSPGGVGNVDSSEVDALAAHDEEGGEAEKGHSAADHRQLG